MTIAPDTVVHRLHGCRVANLRLVPLDLTATPPGVSVFIGGTPAEAVAQMRAEFGGRKKWRPPLTVATATVAAIRQAGYDVIFAPTERFANHGRIVHPLNQGGFSDANLFVLAAVFQESTGH